MTEDVDKDIERQLGRDSDGQWHGGSIERDVIGSGRTFPITYYLRLLSVLLVPDLR